MIIFMGVAGSGKSMQGRRLADELAVPWLSTGEFLRMLVAGERRKSMIAGKLLGDQEIISLVQKILSMINSHDEFVLDGFPRTIAQADWLLAQVRHGQLAITAMINLEASKHEVVRRLSSRGRPDDAPEAIAERFEDYERTTKPILKEFAAAGIPVVTIDGNQSVEAVHAAIMQALKK
jgi:adenylate kinase